MRIFILLIFSILYFNAGAQTYSEDEKERILNFHADITVEQTGLIRVKEHIKVFSKSQRILHGIVRSIPLYRKDIFGKKQRTELRVTSVRKNGSETPYTLTDEGDNRKVYIGKANEAIESGSIAYEINYEADGQIGFSDAYDEIYWNVTGNGWGFDIDKASAHVIFPAGAAPGSLSCYTGINGAKNQQCKCELLADHSVIFETRGKLKPGEGLTIAAAFTRDTIKRPGLLTLLFTDYLMVVCGVLMLLAAAAVYYFLWKKYGKDPVKPVIIPSFRIPKGWSPALLRFFYKKEYDEKALAAAMVNLAVNKFIQIKGMGGSVYTFEKTSGNQHKLAAEEKLLMQTMFRSGHKVTTTRVYGKVFVQARAKFQHQLESQLKLGDYFMANYKLAIGTGFATITVLSAYTFLITGSYDAFRLLLAFPFFLIGLYLVKHGISSLKKSIWASLLIFAASLPFIVVPVGICYLCVRDLPLAMQAFLLVLAVMYLIFFMALKTCSKEGMEIETEIEGFKLYLNTAEEQRLNLLNPPQHTQEIFERFLPYAMALDVENAWAEKFTEVLERAGNNHEWYNSEDIPYKEFVTAMPVTFYQSLAVSAPATSSSDSSDSSSSGSSGSSAWSSGSNGHGSSGGGGGGGGGDGW